jgi:hypothetical protein
MMLVGCTIVTGAEPMLGAFPTRRRRQGRAFGAPHGGLRSLTATPARKEGRIGSTPPNTPRQSPNP